MVRLAHPRYKIYIIPYPKKRFYVGATQIESNSTDSLTVQSALELLSALYTVDPGFGEASIERMISGQRPTFYDAKPKLIKKGNTTSVNGLYRHGFLLAPLIASKAVSLMHRKDNFNLSVENIK